MALLGKWIWIFTLEENAAWRLIKKKDAWRKYIEVKYGIDEDGWFTKHPGANHGVGLWKSISNE